MTLNDIKRTLLKVPGARTVRKYLLAQGHTEREADGAGVAAACLILFVFALLLNTFVFGVIRTYFNSLWAACVQSAGQAVGVGIFATLIFLSLVFHLLNRSTAKKAERQYQDRRDQHQFSEKRQQLRGGAMGHFEEVFRTLLSKKYPGIEIQSVYMVGTVPRIRFKAQKFAMEPGGKVEKNYQLFRDTLFSDTLLVIETALELTHNVPAVIVDAMMGFINRGAKYYDGAVLSVKARRDVFRNLDLQNTNPLRVLNAFELRYRDGMEVEVLPEEEDKTAKVLERIRENAPRVDIRYGSSDKKTEVERVKPKVPEVQVGMDAIQRPQDIGAMPLAPFQDLVVGLLSKLGFDIQKVKRVPGGTVQISADYDHAVIGGNFMVLARQHPEGSQVHADLVRELNELAQEDACKRGIYMVTGQFTEEARNVSRSMAVDLVEGKGLFELVKSPPFDEGLNFSVLDERGVVTELSRLSLLDFEKEVDRFLKRSGFRGAKFHRTTGGSVVGVVEHRHPIIGGKFAVLAKQFPPETQVPVEQLKEFAHVMQAEFCRRGVLMATAGFSLEARALSRSSGVELVDGNTWENLRRRMGGGD